MRNTAASCLSNQALHHRVTTKDRVFGNVVDVFENAFTGTAFGADNLDAITAFHTEFDVLLGFAVGAVGIVDDDELELLLHSHDRVMVTLVSDFLESRRVEAVVAFFIDHVIVVGAHQSSEIFFEYLRDLGLAGSSDALHDDHLLFGPETHCETSEVVTICRGLSSSGAGGQNLTRRALPVSTISARRVHKAIVAY